ncbi:MAG: hypothetical protein WCK31_01485 [bacterium]
MKLPTSLTTVTTLSKTLALIIFITLPIACFVLGINYGMSISTFSVKYDINSKSSTTQSTSSNSLTCGVTNCHGTDVTCGYQSDRTSCTMLYSMGDKCRQYVSCKETSGTCQKIEDPRYSSCVSCIQKCNSLSDYSAFSTCESKCE